LRNSKDSMKNHFSFTTTAIIVLIIASLFFASSCEYDPGSGQDPGDDKYYEGYEGIEMKVASNSIPRTMYYYSGEEMSWIFW